MEDTAQQQPPLRDGVPATAAAGGAVGADFKGSLQASSGSSSSVYALHMPPGSPQRGSSGGGGGGQQRHHHTRALSNHHLLLAEEDRASYPHQHHSHNATPVDGSGRASPDAADFGRRMSISHDAWPTTAAHPGQHVPSVVPLQHLQSFEFKHQPVGASLSTPPAGHSSPTTPIALTYHSSPAVAAANTNTNTSNTSATSLTSLLHVPTTAAAVAAAAASSARSQQQQQSQHTPALYFNPPSSTQQQQPQQSQHHLHPHHHLQQPPVPLKRSTMPLHSTLNVTHALGPRMAGGGGGGGGVVERERPASAAAQTTSGAEALGGRSISANSGSDLLVHQQTPHFPAHSQLAGPYPHVLAHQLPIQLLNQSSTGGYYAGHAAYLSHTGGGGGGGGPPLLSRDASIDALSHSDSVSVCSSATGSSRNSPSRMSQHVLSHNHATFCSQASSLAPSAFASSVVSKSNSQTQLHQLSPRERTPEPQQTGTTSVVGGGGGGLITSFPVQHVFTATAASAAVAAAVASSHRRTRSLQHVASSCISEADEGRSPALSCDADATAMPLHQQQQQVSSTTSSTQSHTRSLNNGVAGTKDMAPGSVDSAGSVGSLNAAVEQLVASDSPVVAYSGELSAPGVLTRSDTSSSSSSTTSRNANNKRARSDLDAETGVTAAATAKVQTLKTSSNSAASSVQAEAQLARQEAAVSSSAAPVAPAVAAPAQAAATAAPAGVVASSASAAGPASLAPLTAKRSALISVLSCVLSQLFSNPSDTLPSDARMLTRFHTERLPNIGIGAYLERIAHYSECSDEALVQAFIHISRISHNKPHFHLNALSIHRLLLTAILTTVKFYDDLYYNNCFYAKIGGVALREINALEIDFLELIQFELYIDTKVYCRFYEELKNAQLHPSCHCAFERMIELDMDEVDNPPQI